MGIMSIMKKFLFFVLVVGFVAAAFFTRPQDPRKSFTDFLVARMTQGDKSGLHEQWDELRAKRFADECSYVDRYLWVDVKKEGTTVYTGAFSHWFNRAEVKETVQRNIDEAKEKERS